MLYIREKIEAEKKSKEFGNVWRKELFKENEGVL